MAAVRCGSRFRIPERDPRTIEIFDGRGWRFDCGLLTREDAAVRLIALQESGSRIEGLTEKAVEHSLRVVAERNRHGARDQRTLERWLASLEGNAESGKSDAERLRECQKLISRVRFLVAGGKSEAALAAIDDAPGSRVSFFETDACADMPRGNHERATYAF
jgi:hypothetical protein